MDEEKVEGWIRRRKRNGGEVEGMNEKVKE